MRWTLDLTTGYLVLEPNPSLSPQPGHFPFLVLRFPTWLGLPTGTDSYQLHSIHAQNSSEERGHHPMDKCWWRWWWVIVAVPAGHIIEGWPEKECQVGRVNPDSEGSLGHLMRGPGLERAGNVAMTGPYALLKSGEFPSVPYGLTHLSFSPFTFLNTYLFWSYNSPGPVPGRNNEDKWK